MKHRIRTGRPSGTAIMRVMLAFSLMAAAGSPAVAKAPDSVQVASLARQLKNAHYARIGIDGRTLVLRKPAATATGLGYRSIEIPNGRPAVITDSSPDTIAAPPNPVPWSTLERIEAGNRSNHAVTGALVGLLGGLALGGYASAFAEMEGGNDGWQAMLVVTALTTLIGTGIGALFQSTEWTQVHPEPTEAAR